MATLQELLADPDFKSLRPDRQRAMREDFFRDVISKDPDFTALPEPRRLAFQKEALGDAPAGAPRAPAAVAEEPSFLQKHVVEPVKSGLESAGRTALSLYKSLDPTEATSALEAGFAPIAAGMSPAVVGGEFAGETARKATEPLGPNISAAIGTAANLGTGLLIPATGIKPLSRGRPAPDARNFIADAGEQVRQEESVARAAREAFDSTVPNKQLSLSAPRAGDPSKMVVDRGRFEAGPIERTDFETYTNVSGTPKERLQAVDDLLNAARETVSPTRSPTDLLLEGSARASKGKASGLPKTLRLGEFDEAPALPVEKMQHIASPIETERRAVTAIEEGVRPVAEPPSVLGRRQRVVWPTTTSPASPQRLTANEVLEKVRSQQEPRYFDEAQIQEKIARGGESYVKTEVDPSTLKIKDDGKLDPGLAVPEKGPIVVGADGSVIDGRHRAVAARRRGETTIEAYVPEAVGTKKQIGQTVIDAPTRAEVEEAKSVLQSAADPHSDFGRFRALYSGTLEESGKTVSKFGETGQRLTQTLRGVRDDAEREAGTAVADLKRNLSKLTQPEKENLVDVLDRGSAPISGKVAEVAARERSKLDAIAQRATDARLEIHNPVTGEKAPFSPRTNFFPHSAKQTLEEIARDPKARAKAVQAIQRQDGVSADRAGKIFDAMVKNTRGRYGHLEVARVYDLGEYDKNPLTALSNYYARGLRRVREAEQLGPNNEKAYEAAELIGQQFGDRAKDFSKTLVDRMTRRDNLGLGGRIASDIGGTVRGFEAATKLGQAVIANSSQTALTAVVAGVRNTARGIKAAMTKEGQEFALKSGATLTSAIHDFLREAAGVGGRSLGERAGEKVLKVTGFSAVERANRVVAANAGRFFAQDAFEKILRAPKSRSGIARLITLRRMGVDVDAALVRGELAETDLLKAGQRMVNMTQFKTDPIELPLLWSSPYGRIVTQFKSFAFRSGKLLKDDVLKPALDYTRTGGRRGSLGPILRAATILPIAGEAVADLRAAIRNRQRPDNILIRIAEDYAAVGTMGLFADTWRAASFGKGGVLGLIAGPTVSDVAELGTGTIQALQGEPKTLAKQATRNLPVVGPTLAGELFQREKALRPQLRERVNRGDLRR